MRNDRFRLFVVPTLAVLTGLVFVTTALAGHPTTPYVGPIQYREPVRICRLHADGTRGPWVPYFHSEGTATCPGHGFDSFEPVISAVTNPCGVALGFPANGVGEGGLDPFCTIGPAAAGCPVDAYRWLFGMFGTYATGGSTHPLNPPTYAVGQDVCEMDFLFTENAAAGATDSAGHVIGNTFIDVVWHSTFNAVPPDCGTQPLLGDIVDGVGLDFGPATGNGAGGPGFFFTNVGLDELLIPPLPVMPAPGGAYSFYYWNVVPPGLPGTGGMVSGNTQPGGWGFKDAMIQGSSGIIGYQNDDFSVPTDDNGSQIDTALECFDFSAVTLCPQPVIVASLRLGVLTEAPPTPVTIASANPPAAAQNGGVPYRDVLENTSAALVAEGIGVAGTPAEGSVTFAPFQVTFSGAPATPPTAGNITVACTDMVGNGQADCPTVTTVSGSGAGPYSISLSAVPPVRECTTFTFLSTVAGQKLQYQNLPGDLNRNGTTTGQDVLAIVSAINGGTAGGDLPRYDVNRNGAVTGQDVLREVQLINGGVSVSPATGYNAATVAACP